MVKKTRKKKKKATNQPRSVPAKQKSAKYSPGEIAMAVLGAALVIMVGVIIVTSLLE